MPRRKTKTESKEGTFYDTYNYPHGSKGRELHWEGELSKHIDLSKINGLKILDAGCGQGIMANILHKYGADVYAIDLSEDSISYVKQNHPEIKAKVNDVLNLDFQDNYFDIVFSLGVLHHTPNAYKGFTECVRVTKPGGKIIILLYTKYHIYPICYKIGRLLSRGRKPEDTPKIIIKTVRKVLELYFKEERTDQDAIHIIADQFFTPIVTFHSTSQVREWCRKNGLELHKTSTNLFWQNRIYEIIKPRQRKKSGKEEK